MSYHEENDHVILTMSQEDFGLGIRFRTLGTPTTRPTRWENRSESESFRENYSIHRVSMVGGRQRNWMDL